MNVGSRIKPYTVKPVPGGITLPAGSIASKIKAKKTAMAFFSVALDRPPKFGPLDGRLLAQAVTTFPISLRHGPWQVSLSNIQHIMNHYGRYSPLILAHVQSRRMGHSSLCCRLLTCHQQIAPPCTLAAFTTWLAKTEQTLR